MRPFLHTVGSMFSMMPISQTFFNSSGVAFLFVNWSNNPKFANL